MYVLTTIGSHPVPVQFPSQPARLPALQRKQSFYIPIALFALIFQLQWLASVIVGLAAAGDAILTVTLITLLLRRRTGFIQYVRVYGSMVCII